MSKNPGTATVKTPASNFTGDVWMNPVFGGDGTSQLTCGFVGFTPGARTTWHSHANGQRPTAGVYRRYRAGGTRDGKTPTVAGVHCPAPAPDLGDPSGPDRRLRLPSRRGRESRHRGARCAARGS